MNDSDLHIAIVQYDLLWENPEENRAYLTVLFKELPPETELLVLPEMFSTGFSMNVEQFAEPMTGTTITWMKDQAHQLGKVIAGSLMVYENGNYYNRFVFVRPNGTIDFYDKRHLFSMGQEHIHFTSGNERKVFQLKSFRILPQVCYDLRFPVFSRNQHDYDLLINCANWPAPRQQVWNTLLKARAIENQVYVAGVNRVGKDANRINYAGGSLIIDPKGKEMIEATCHPQIITAKLSYHSLNRFRMRFPAQDDADNFSLSL